MENSGRLTLTLYPGYAMTAIYVQTAIRKYYRNKQPPNWAAYKQGKSVLTALETEIQDQGANMIP